MHNKSEQRPLIVFAEDWGAHPSSTQHLIKVLCQSRNIIWINSIGLRKPKLTWRDVIRAWHKIVAYFKGNNKRCRSQSQTINSMGFKVISPLVLPCADSRWTIRLNQWLLAKQLAKPLKLMNIDDPIIWCSLPTAVDYLALFKDSPSIYYCGDDFGSLAGVDHRDVLHKESQLVPQVSYVFTASKALLSKFPQHKSVNIPHGVNYELFNNKPTKRPDDLPKSEHIAGFYGSVSTWIDQELIAHAANLLPNWEFVLIGKVECNVDTLQAIANIHFISPKSHTELPAYIQHWNVALLPFKDNRQIKMCNPLKLREYLASGTPVVSTDFPALEPYKEHVMTVRNKQDIGRAITLANINITGDIQLINAEKNLHRKKNTASEKITSVVTARTQSVVGESWCQRAAQVQKYLILC